MKAQLRGLAIIAALAISVSALAQAPAGSTGQCKDGSYSSADTKKGACAKHGGVKEWYPAGTTAEKAAPAPAATEPSKAKSPTATRSTTADPASSPVAGGGPGQVWVNTRSKVYHCQGDKWYGKTKEGEYMTEQAAKAAGSRPDHGKACA